MVTKKENEKLDFSEADISVLNTTVSSILESSEFEHEKPNKIIDNLKNNLKTILNADIKLLESDAGPVLHARFKEKDTKIDLFIHTKTFVSSKNEEPFRIGNISIDFVKWEKSQHKCNTITVVMIREEIGSKIDELIKNLNINLCGSGYGWFFASYNSMGVFEEKTSRLLIPLPIIYYRSKKSYHQKPDRYHQIDCVKLLYALSLNSVY
jgi:hypothetical protein